MSGGNESGGGSALTKYVIPGLETLGGAVSEFFAPGNPLGTAALGSGVGQLGGGALGGSTGQAIGGALGGVGGGLAAPALAPSAAPSLSNIGTALSQDPGTAGITPSMVSGVSGSTPNSGFSPPATSGAQGQTGAPATNGAPATQAPAWNSPQSLMAGASQVGQIYLNYLAQKNLKQTPDPTAYAAAHSSPVGQAQFNLLPQTTTSVPNQF